MLNRNPQKYGGWLLASLLALHLGGPVVNHLLPGASAYATLFFYLALLTAATATLAEHTRGLAVAIAFSLPVAFVAGAGAFGIELMQGHRMGLLIGACAVPLQVYAGLSTFRYVLHTGFITRHRLMGTATVFLLFAHAWAGLYALVELLMPGSFARNGAGETTLDELMYFSLVTQTTLGYGDVTPVWTMTRSLATLQAVAGLFYMGVIVARLAGKMDLQEVERGDEAEDDAREAGGNDSR